MKNSLAVFVGGEALGSQGMELVDIFNFTTQDFSTLRYLSYNLSALALIIRIE